MTRDKPVSHPYLPTLATRRDLDVNGVRFSVIEAGRGEPVLLLHGYPQSALTWRHQIAPLAETHRVVAPDWLGWGESERRFDTLPRYWGEIARLEALLDTLAMPRCNLIAHDYGAFLALGFAGRHPQRVQRLAVLNSRAHRRFPLATFALFAAIRAAALSPSPRGLAEHLPLGDLHRRLMQPHRARGCFDNALLERYVGWLDQRAGRRWLLHFFRHYQLGRQPALIGGLPRIQCPAAVIWGDEDSFCPWAIGADLAERLTDASLTRVAGADHFVMEERPAEVTNALRDLLQRPAHDAG